MNKILSLLFIAVTLATATAKAQSVAINTTGATANGTAILDVSSNLKGVLIPRMTSVQRAGIATPANGLLVYDTDSIAFSYFNGTAWTFIKTGKDTATAWSTKGNAGLTTSNFLGTTDNTNIIFKRNNVFAGRISTTATAFGVESGAATNSFNTAFGYRNMVNSISGIHNTAVGDSNFFYGSSGNNNIAIGSRNIPYVSGSNNIGIGSFNFNRDFYSGQNFMNNIAIGTSAQNQQWHGFENIAMGTNALYSDTVGNNNIAIGYHTLEQNLSGYNNIGMGKNAANRNTTGYSNIAIGAGALYNNTTPSNLVAIGDSTLYNNGTGATLPYHATFNTAIGSKALFSNTSGAYNTANGIYALADNTTGNNNTANGTQALTSNIDGNDNTANGYHALLGNTTGDYNTASGSNALQNNDDGSNNTANGRYALFNNVTGSYNTASGSSALAANSTGYYNTANGYYALLSNNTGSDNTANGALTLVNNIGGSGNTATGSNALYNNTTGFNNTANGDSALYNNNIGYSNVAVVKKALYRSATRSNLVAIGDSALYNNGVGALTLSDGNWNTGIGSKALFRNSTGFGNTATGYNTLYSNTTGFFNTASGFQALVSNTNGLHNTADGTTALSYNSTGSYNTASGSGALFFNNTGSYNTALGYIALRYNQSGDLNTAIGDSALHFNTASFNTALGAYALSQNNTGANNVAVGVKAGSSLGNDNGSYNTYIGDSSMMLADRINSTVIGSKAYTSTSNSMVLGSINGVNGATADVKVGIGVTNPTEKLEIGNGRLRFRGNAPFGNAHGITWTNNAGTIDRAFMGMETDNFFGIYNFGFPTGWNVRLHNTTGEMGINKQPGTTGSESRLQVKQASVGAGNGIGIETAINTNRWDMWVDNTAAPDYNFSYNGSLRGYFQNATGNYIVVSDRRFKKDVNDFSASLSNINQLKAYQYHYSENSAADPFSIGFMAQDVQKLFPDAVSEKVMDDGNKRLGVNYQYFTVLAIKGLQEQQSNIDTQNKKIEVLENQLAELKKLLEQYIKK